LKTIVSGIEKTQEEKDEEAEEEKEHTPVDVAYLTNVKGVPDYWVKCLKNNKMCQELIKENDRDAFTKLKSVKVEDKITEDRKRVRTLTLTFGENEYFTNETLTLTIKYADQEPDEPSTITACTINWKDGKDLTKKKIKKK
jgi:nucleosome assembly protein 1-like 1